MLRILRLVLVVSCCAFGCPAWGHQSIKGIKLAISNPSSQPRPATNVVVAIAEIRKIAPDFTPGAAIVTATDAATVDQDAATLQTSELPSQVDDLDGDGKGDELAFQIDLGPSQTRIVTISYGAQDRIWRLRGDYVQRTNALFSRKIEGPGWESERIAFRIYLDPRNAIDIYAKRRPSLQLNMYASPDYTYHDESPEGRDIFRVGGAIGIGGVAAMLDGKLAKVADVKERKWRIISTGPVRAILEVEYNGWKLGGKVINLRSRITQWAGERGFWHTITADSADDTQYVTGFPVNEGIRPRAAAGSSGSTATWIETWGEQVVEPGLKALESIVRGQYLGLAIITTLPNTVVAEDQLNHLLKFQLQKGTASWYAMAAWDQEGTNRRIGFGNQDGIGEHLSLVLPPNAITTEDAFVAAVKDQGERMAAPLTVRMVSTATMTQPAPADTSVPLKSKSIDEGIALIRQGIDRTAMEWEPVLRSSTAGSFGPRNGLGFFTEGDNKTAKWQQQNGYFWTGSFWIGQLWQMYGLTHEEKYRAWAELWEAKLLGQELQQNHDAGFLYYYSAALGYDLTDQQALLGSAHHAAERLQQLFNPRTQLIASWAVNGDDTIIDTMMNLQLLWWVSNRTGETKWRDMGQKHALRTADWFIRPDGSVIQSVHYNPGDNRQEFPLHGGASRDMPLKVANSAAGGERVFSHTHQGFGPDTTWSRGLGWAIYGFSVAYAETHDPKLLKTAERVADYAIANLPDDGVPWYDFCDEGVHFRNRDTSATAIIAGGLLRLSTVSSDKIRGEQYRQAAEHILQSLLDRYLTPVGEGDSTPPGVLRHGSSTRPNDSMLIYGQYYLLEDLLWLKEHKR